MVQAIERPRPEVWPFRPSRWALTAGTLVPRVVDRLLAKRMIVGQTAPLPEEIQSTKSENPNKSETQMSE